MSAYQVIASGKQIALIQFAGGEWCLQTHRDNGTNGRIDRFETLSEAKEEARKSGKVNFVRVKP